MLEEFNLKNLDKVPKKRSERKNNQAYLETMTKLLVQTLAQWILVDPDGGFNRPMLDNILAWLIMACSTLCLTSSCCYVDIFK